MYYTMLALHPVFGIVPSTCAVDWAHTDLVVRDCEYEISNQIQSFCYALFDIHLTFSHFTVQYTKRRK